MSKSGKFVLVKEKTEMEEIKPVLKGLIDQRGVGYLEKNAYAVYRELKSQKLEKFCGEQGFKLVSFTCDGDMSDFESNDDRW